MKKWSKIKVLFAMLLVITMVVPSLVSPMNEVQASPYDWSAMWCTGSGRNSFTKSSESEEIVLTGNDGGTSGVDYMPDKSAVKGVSVDIRDNKAPDGNAYACIQIYSGSDVIGVFYRAGNLVLDYNGGSKQVYDGLDMKPASDEWYTLKVEWDDTTIKVSYGGNVMLTDTYTVQTPSRIELVATGSSNKSSFKNVEIIRKATENEQDWDTSVWNIGGTWGKETINGVTVLTSATSGESNLTYIKDDLAGIYGVEAYFCKNNRTSGAENAGIRIYPEEGHSIVICHRNSHVIVEWGEPGMAATQYAVAIDSAKIPAYGAWYQFSVTWNENKLTVKCNNEVVVDNYECPSVKIGTPEKLQIYTLDRSSSVKNVDIFHNCIGGKATCQQKATCTICGEQYGELAAHTEVDVPGKEATCKETGLTAGKKCSVCGTVTIEQTEIDKKAHTEEDIPEKEATCTETGLTAGKKCSVCGTVTIEQTEIDKKTHTEEDVPEKEATCTETGLTAGKKCSVCGTVTIKQTEIKVKEHSYKEGKCQVCGAKDSNYTGDSAGTSADNSTGTSTDNSENASTTPKTGDNTPVMMLFVAFAVSSSILAKFWNKKKEC